MVRTNTGESASRGCERRRGRRDSNPLRYPPVFSPVLSSVFVPLVDLRGFESRLLRLSHFWCTVFALFDLLTISLSKDFATTWYGRGRRKTSRMRGSHVGRGFQAGMRDDTRRRETTFPRSPSP